MIRLLLADDQALVRGALAALLELEPDLEVVAEVGRGDEVVAAARRAPPRRRPARRRDARAGRDRGDRARCAAALPSCRVLDRHHLRPARATCAGRWRPGASGFVVKDTPARQLADAVRRVHAGPAGRRPRARRRDLVAGASRR